MKTVLSGRTAVPILIALMLGTVGIAPGDSPGERLGPDDAFSQSAGWDVAIDGEFVAIGAPLDREAGRGAGAVHVFRRRDGRWELHDKLMAPSGGRESFGHAVGLDGTVLAVGARLTLSASGDRAGAVYVFERSDHAWVQVARLVDPAGREADGFGSVVAVSESRIAVGAPRSDPLGSTSGSVHVFERGADGAWTLDEVVTLPGGRQADRLGIAVALEGRRLLVGGRAAGGVAVLFRRRPRGWKEVTRFDGTDGPTDIPGFGVSVALRGRHLAVGAPRAPGKDELLETGRVRVYRRQRGVWVLDGELFGDVFGLSSFGQDVALEGRRLLVGAPDHFGSVDLPGQAQLFRRRPRGWTRIATHAPPELGGAALFGQAVDLDRGRVIVGAPGDDLAASGEGAAWLFR